jgi:hypothetical protein
LYLVFAIFEAGHVLIILPTLVKEVLDKKKRVHLTFFTDSANNLKFLYKNFCYHKLVQSGVSEVVDADKDSGGNIFWSTAMLLMSSNLQNVLCSQFIGS